MLNGYDYSEAVVDGFKGVTELEWKKDALKFVFHIADAPPHGSQFSPFEADSFPLGCPCNL